jgi:hypothetical protein
MIDLDLDERLENLVTKAKELNASTSPIRLATTPAILHVPNQVSAQITPSTLDSLGNGAKFNGSRSEQYCC